MGKDEKEALDIELDEDVVRSLEQICAQRGCSIEDLILEILDQELGQIGDRLDKAPTGDR